MLVNQKTISRNQAIVSKKNPVKWLRMVLFSAILVAGVLSFYALSQTVTPIPVNLSAEPLHGSGGNKYPTLSLNLSVEFPAAAAQYQEAYAEASTYLGYFDHNGCYAYNNNATPELRRFDRIGNATVHNCGGTSFSGNFMNWASSAAIDIVRYALSGGDRILDTANETILQRALVPNSEWFWNTYQYKTLPAAFVQGALPNDLKGTHTGNVQITNCLNRIHFGTGHEGSCDAPGASSNLGVAAGANGTKILSSDNFFYSRVKVCESSGGVLQDPRPDLCTKQLSGNFKPTGLLQEYSDRIRVGAFGYLQSSTPGTTPDDLLANPNVRYGGVLRAPIKFLGATAYDDDGVLIAGTNPKMEWNETTGVFVDNPEGITGPLTPGALNSGLNSGVINFLNKFGRTSATPGWYRYTDPVSEMYYENLRYLQGLNPTPDAVSNIDGVNLWQRDGFDVKTTWVDPHKAGDPANDYSCLKNNILVFSDVFNHADRTVPGNTVTTAFGDLPRGSSMAANEPNFQNWTNVVGGFEAGTNVGYTTGDGATATTTNPNPANNALANMGTVQAIPAPGLADMGSYLLSGMAYWANTHDIRGTTWTGNVAKQRPGMRVTTHVIDIDESKSSSSNAVTRRTTNQLFMAAKYGGFDDVSGIGNPFLTAAGDTDNYIWQKQENQGEAKRYYLASNSQDIIDGFKTIFSDVASQATSVAAGSITTSKYTEGGYIFTTSFNSENWSGDVISTSVTATAGDITLGDIPQWSAAAVLDAKPNTFFQNTRNVIAGRPEGNISGDTAIKFDWNSVNANGGELLASLNKISDAAPNDGLANKRVAYLRGDKDTETAAPYFRIRTSKLGDIVNSATAYSKDFFNNVNTTSYDNFKTANSTRPGALFVGANDGMLHAFDTSNGEELFAYIPGFLSDKLSALTDPAYVHQSYVDGKTDVAEALIGSATAGSWKTVLVSAAGGGGQGVFALDVSNPANFDATHAIWEFSDRDDKDLGNVMGTPKIVKMRTNKSSATTATYEWFAAVPSGVNNFVSDGHTNTTSKPYLFLLSLNKTPGAPWSLGTNYFKFEITTNDTLSATQSPGVINLEAVTGADGKVDQMYMGDLHGNLWKLDFNAAAAAGADLKDVTFAKLIVNNASKPLFVATDAAGNHQPIVLTPKVIYGPNNGKLIIFGTGKYMEDSDNLLTPVRTQSMYVINDYDATPKYIASRAFLQQGTVSNGVITVNDFVWGRAATAGDTTQRSGWFIDFPSSGERQFSDVVVSGGQLLFGTLLPPPETLDDPCGVGQSQFYSINYATGEGLVTKSTVGIISQIFVGESAEASSNTISDSTGRRTKTITRRSIVRGSDGMKPGESITEIVMLGRLSWRQINNYQELKNSSSTGAP